MKEKRSREDQRSCSGHPSSIRTSQAPAVVCAGGHNEVLPDNRPIRITYWEGKVCLRHRPTPGQGASSTRTVGSVVCDNSEEETSACIWPDIWHWERTETSPSRRCQMSTTAMCPRLKEANTVHGRGLKACSSLSSDPELVLETTTSTMDVRNAFSSTGYILRLKL